MAAQFDKDGIRFRYPENWRLEREDSEEGWTVSVQSPGTAFLMICLRQDMPTPDSMIDSVLTAMREEYPELEADDRVESVAGQPAVGHDIRFFSLDLTNTCWTRSFSSTRGTLLLMCQTNDLELDQAGPVLKAICSSLEVEED
jgi:hypothetical protein